MLSTENYFENEAAKYGVRIICNSKSEDLTLVIVAVIVAMFVDTVDVGM